MRLYSYAIKRRDGDKKINIKGRIVGRQRERHKEVDGRVEK